MFVMGNEAPLETTTYNSTDDGIIVIDVRVLQTVMNKRNPDCPYFQAFCDAHNANTAVKELSGEAKAKLIEKKEAAYDAFVLECRATKDEYDKFAHDPLWDETTRRLENEVAAYRGRLQEVIATHRPIASNFPTQKEIAAYDEKKAAAQAAVNKKQNELSGHQSDDALRTASINRNRVHIAQLIEREKQLRNELSRLKGQPQTEVESKKYGLAS
jgi:hypothetical protein